MYFRRPSTMALKTGFWVKKRVSWVVIHEKGSKNGFLGSKSDFWGQKTRFLNTRTRSGFFHTFLVVFGQKTSFWGQKTRFWVKKWVFGSKNRYLGQEKSGEIKRADRNGHCLGIRLGRHNSSVFAHLQLPP